MTFTSPNDEKSHHHFPQTCVPLRLARPDHPIILVDVLINAMETYQFMLDTGASQTIVSPRLAQRMGMPDAQADSLIGVGGVTQSSVGTLRSLSVGEASLKNSKVIVADIFSQLGQALGDAMDGILGFNFLSRFKVVIDYPNQKLGFEASHDLPVSHSTAKQPV